MATLAESIHNDLTTARKAQDKALTMLLGTVVSDLKNKKIELQHELTDAETIDVLRKSIKRRRESIEMYTKADRKELADKEQYEATTLEKYLPASVDPEEIRSAVRAAIAEGANTIGLVMGKVLPKFKGRAEGSAVNAIAREELGKQG
jgi:uncharacterized protein YqeY